MEGRVCERLQDPGKGTESGKGKGTSETRQKRSRSHRRPDQAIYVPRALRERAGQGSPALLTSDPPKSPALPTIGSTDCSLNLSALEKSHADAHEDCAPISCPNQEPATDELLETSVDLPEPSDWEQTVSYFVAMSLDDQLDDDGGSLCSAHPDAQQQIDGAKDSEDYLEEISGQLKEADITIESVHGDYSGYENLWIAPGEFPHVIEIYDFPASFKTEDLLDAFAEFSEGGLKIKWVDNTHALGVFSSESAALQALCLQHPLVKVRSLCEGSKKSVGKALRRAEFIQPVKERPRTNTTVARRMVSRALGLPKPVQRGKRC